MTEYKKTKLKDTFSISNIFTIHYFEFESNYVFTGESHDFWEFVYIDKGIAEIFMNDKWLPLKSGEIVFHKPNQFHNLRSNGSVAPNIVIISFECTSEEMKFFNDRTLNVSSDEKKLIARIIHEASNAFSTPLGNPFTPSLIQNPIQNIGSEQLIRIYLEQLLISIRRNDTEKKQMSILKENSDSSTFNNIIHYFEQNVFKKLTIDMICKNNHVSRTTAKNLFKERTGMGIITYFRYLKIEKAKTLIREKNYNFTQISTMLGYETIHHFSSQFKNVTGMSPSEYAKSVKIDFE